MTERMVAVTVGGWIQGKDSERRSQDGGSNSQILGGDITKESEEMQIEALKERLTRAARKCMHEENISAVTT